MGGGDISKSTDPSLLKTEIQIFAKTKILPSVFSQCSSPNVVAAGAVFGITLFVDDVDHVASLKTGFDRQATL